MSQLIIGNQEFDKHEVAIIKRITFGMCDNFRRPVLRFDARQPHSGSMQILEGDEITEFLSHDFRGKGIWTESIEHLEGCPVVILREDGFVRIVGLWRP